MSTVIRQEAVSFIDGVNEFIRADPDMGAFLTRHAPDELDGYEIITRDGAGVLVSPDGDIQNLFNNGDTKGIGRELTREATRAGGRTLDCFDGFLPGFYESLGFRETGRMRFDREYAPEGWNFDRFGTPDVVFMAYAPELPAERSENYYDPELWNQAKLDSRRAAGSGNGR
jgi:hypothetical protein